MVDAEIEVFVEIGGADRLAGRLWSHRRRRRESATFAYASSYLAAAEAYELDPALPLLDGQQQTAAGRAIFGAFADCAPDRWGRRLILRARSGRGPEGERSLGEIDYLLGVRDDARQGALRFREPGSDLFLAPEHSGVPALTDLPALLTASERIEREEGLQKDLEALLRGGSSLGGARPKAHVRGEGGRLAIAKFPRPERDDRDVIRWEAVALELAAAAGLRVPAWRTTEIGGRAVLIVDRFDREPALNRSRREASRRIGYVSAMTMLEASDGDDGSYLEIADAIEVRSAAPSDDLRELWRRIAFSLLISNTDDHLRNHGFLRRSSAGWSLSPAFDLNPDPDRSPRATTIDFDSAGPPLEALLDVAELFRLEEGEALTVLGEVAEATLGWRRAAAGAGFAPAQIEAMAPAFEHPDAEAARALVAA